ncbi:MAG: hypothetical protein IPL61_15610 [Myxococcales bacterium]|nr:hypothetical protein [Myxococcales bacterium]
MPRPRVAGVLDELVGWYVAHVHGRLEGPGVVPFYCDPARVGGFAVDPTQLAVGDDRALFRLFVALAMFQSRRDVDIMAIQRGMPRRAAEAMLAPRRLALAIDGARCQHLRAADGFDAGCSVYRVPDASGASACADRPRTPCHVKDATSAIGRMGDMGKLATSAWLRLRDDGDHGFGARFARVCAAHATPAARADALVADLAGFYRVADKLATFIVATLTVPELAPGLTPWHPVVDGHHLVIVDANVARVIDALRPRGPRTYGARAAWWRRHAGALDLRRHRAAWPASSPRLVQQAAYWFRSRSNRDAAGLPCAAATAGDRCGNPVCPYCAG